MSRAMITGAGRGIGRALALEFARQDHDLVLISRTSSELDKVKAEVKGFRPNLDVKCISVDVQDETKVRSLFEEVPSLDLLVNNAGFIKVEPIEKLSPENWAQTIAVNLSGPFIFCQEAVKLMAKSRRGCIINIGSLAGIQSAEKIPGFCAYSAAKAGLLGFTQCLALETKNFGIRVHYLAPGAVDTRMLREAAPHFRTSTQPEEIAEEVLKIYLDPKAPIVKELTNV